MNRRFLFLILVLMALAVVSVGAASAQTSPATWFVTYYDNGDLEGNPVRTASEGVIDHSWGTGAPADGVPANDWSARWSTYKDFEAGTYRFTITSDDGARIYLGDKHVHNDWSEHPVLTSYIDVSLTGGRYPIAVDYFDDTGHAELKLGWQRTGAAVAGAADVTVISRGTIGGTPTPAPTGSWYATYWNNRDLQGTPVLRRNESSVDYNWGNGSPASGVNADNWSARWTRQVYFSAGTYRFHATSDDGVRVFVGDRHIINDWSDHAARETTATVTLSAGTHSVAVDYYEHGGGALLRVWWERVSDSGGPTPAPEDYWYATYWNNRNLQGTPVVSRNEVNVDYNWGNGAPAGGVSVDNWSARWTRRVHFGPGTYRFRVVSDDGVRVTVGDRRIIDDWGDHAAREASAEVALSAGTYPVTVEFYEHGGEAVLRFWWEYVGGTTPPSPTPSGQWSASYWNNRDLQGTPVRSRNETAIDYNWGNGSPLSGVNADNWSARWTRNVYFTAGTYRFTAISDDGVRVMVDNGQTLADWSDHAAREATATVSLAEGTHSVTVEYYEHTGEARLHVSWQRISDGGTGTGGGVSAAPRVHLRMRAGPDTTYTILDVVPPGTIVPVIARTESGDWIQVEYRGRVGWMYSGLTTIYGNLDTVPLG